MVEKFEVRTPTHSCLVDITDRIEQIARKSGIQDGLCHVFVPHTTAGITINENADPTVQADILQQLEKTVPWRGQYSHSEGNSAAHIKASLMGSSQLILISRARLELGTWQGIFLAEFDGPRTRQVLCKIVAG